MEAKEYNESTLTALAQMHEVLCMTVEASQQLVQVFADSIIDKMREQSRKTVSLEELVLLLDALKDAIGELKK